MLKEKITSDLRDAMKRSDVGAVSVLRMVLAAVRNKEIEKRVQDLSDEETLQVLATEARKRKEAIAGFAQGGRSEQAEKESQELSVLKGYLPQEATEEEIRKVVQDAIAKTGATNAKDMGRVMGAAMHTLKGRTDGAVVQRMVKGILEAGSVE